MRSKMISLIARVLAWLYAPTDGEAHPISMEEYRSRTRLVGEDR